MKSISDLTIVVCSCDKYEDLWYPYFEIFKKNWSDCKYPIVLNTESKKYFHEGLNIKCPNNFFEEVSWSERMKNTLEHIETEYVLITCDDHFIISPVNTREFENAFSILKKNKRITTFSFVPHISPEEKTKWIGNFGLWKMNKSFRVNLDTAIWRKRKLEKLLRDGEDIWQFEVRGTERALWDFSEYYKYKIGVDCIINAPYHQRNGYGVVKGKWCWRMPELFAQYEIEVDFSIRGIMTREECIANVERDNSGDEEYYRYLKQHPFENLLISVKKRIPVRQRIMLSKIKQFLLRRQKSSNVDS